PPREIFGKVMSISDDLMWRYYELCTDLSMERIAALRARVAEGTLHPRQAKADLARSIAADFHGQEAAEVAAREFDRIFSQHEVPDDVPAHDVPPSGRLDEFLVVSGVSASNTQARTLIASGAVTVDGAKISDVKHVLSGRGEHLIKA